MPKFTLVCRDDSGSKKAIVYNSDDSSIRDEDGNDLPLKYQRSPVARAPSASPTGFPLGKSRDIKALKIQLGLSCNYSCEYCSQRFVPHAENGRPEDVGVFVSSMPSWFDGGSDGLGGGVRVEFWGGEPFVYWKTMRPLAEEIRRKYPNIAMQVITNGSLLDEKKNDWLLKMGFSVGLSHDGPGQHVRGPDPMEDPTARAGILDLYAKLKPLGRISINSMIHKDNPSRASVEGWMKAVFGDDVSIGEGSFIDPYDEGGVAMSSPSIEWSKSFIATAMKDVRDGGAFNFSAVHGKVGDFIRSVLDGRAKNSVNQKCGMDNRSNIAVDMSGNVLTCQNVSAAAAAPNGMSHKIGHVSDMNAVLLSSATHWSEREDCDGCAVLHLCRGSCMFLDGELWEKGCDNSYTDNVAFFGLAIEALTGLVVEEIIGGSVRGWRSRPFDGRPLSSGKRVIKIAVASACGQ